MKTTIERTMRHLIFNYKQLPVIFIPLAICLSVLSAHAQPGTVLSHQKISDTQGNFLGILDNTDLFSTGITSIDDLDGDGTTDIAVGARLDDDGGSNRGAVWILFLNSDGTVKSHQKISDTQGNFSGALDNGDLFGFAITSIGDLDGDGITDIAVGALWDGDGGTGRGAVWVLFLNTDGTVKSHQKISDTQGNFTGVLDDGDSFGFSITSIGDLDGDGITDITVGARLDGDGGSNRGAVWILFLNSDGTVKSHQKISDTQGNFLGILDDNDNFGFAVTSIGDLDSDGITDITVGAPNDEDGASVFDVIGAVWILFLNTDGTVKAHQKISALEGNFSGILNDGDRFGSSVASIGDLDGDGITDIAVGARRDDGGAVWILFLNADGTVKSHQKISSTEGNFSGLLNGGDSFGLGVASIGDLDGDGITDIAVGAQGDDDGGSNRGAVWVLFLDGVPIVEDCSDFPCGKNNKKVQVCHVPPGNPSNAHTICISPSAVDAHLAHGDFCGPCNNSFFKSSDSNFQLKVNPNPFSQKTTIEFSSQELTYLVIKVYDITGMLVTTLFNEIAEKDNVYSLEFDAKDLPRGMYYYTVTTETESYNGKIIVVK